MVCEGGGGGLMIKMLGGGLDTEEHACFIFPPTPHPPDKGLKMRPPSQMSFLNMRKTKKSLNNELNERTSFFILSPYSPSQIIFL